MPEVKRGPLSRQELTNLWISVTDPAYHRPFLENPEDSGLEVHEQAHEQMARASTMVDRVTQCMFICPWSGQTDEPASGGAKATGVVLVSRPDGDASMPLTFQKGLVIPHVAEDWGEEGSVEVSTGRRYVVSETRTIGAGERGPIEVPYEAEREGAGFNLPLPGTLNRIDQPGSEFANNGGEIVSGNIFRMPVDPDVLTPAQVGQYVNWLGATTATARRVIAYLGGDPLQVQLDKVGVYQAILVVGTFLENEVIADYTGSVIGENIGTLLSATQFGSSWKFAIDIALPTDPTTTISVIGLTSGATAKLSGIERSAFITPASLLDWEVLDWGADLGVVVDNEESPSGGLSPWLDELGGERRIPRYSGEDDDSYRERVKLPADVVSPNALIRAINRVLLPLGCQGCLREHGEGIAGFFYDAGSSSDVPQDPMTNFAYDMDFALRPDDRFKLLFDFTEMRAFFMVGVCSLGLGDFGFGYDDDDRGFYGRTDGVGFYDGYPVVEANAYKALFDEITRIKAGGVGFVFYREDLGCTP